MNVNDSTARNAPAPRVNATINIAAIILSYENPGDTTRCADSVLESQQQLENVDLTLLIVDNGSSINCLEQLRKWTKLTADQRIHLIENPQNTGYSGGMNCGLEQLSTLGIDTEYIWFLNNDVIAEKTALRSLIDHATKHPNSAILGPTIIDMSTDLVECAGGYRYYPYAAFSTPNGVNRRPEELGEYPAARLDYISGAAMFVKNALLSRIGRLDESYFLYFEELELTRQLLPEEELRWCNEAIVYHRGGGTSSVDGMRHFKARQAALSALIYTARHNPAALPSALICRIVGLFVRGLVTLDPKQPWMAVLATWDFIKLRIKGRVGSKKYQANT